MKIYEEAKEAHFQIYLDGAEHGDFVASVTDIPEYGFVSNNYTTGKQEFDGAKISSIFGHYDPCITASICHCYREATIRPS